MKSMPLVSIIVVNWNGGEVFEKCLASLRQISYPNWELIVIDNGSTDGTQKYAKIKNRTNLGFAPANNQGYKISRGKYILLLNSDTLVDKDFLQILVEKMEKEKDIAVVQPKIRIMDNPSLLDNTGSFITRIGFLKHEGFMEKDGIEFSREMEVFSVKGACMLTRRNAIEKVDLFDEDFMSYFEESDFCWRCWMGGYRVIYYPESVIKHKVGYSIKRLDVGKMNWHYYKNRICSLIKNLEFSSLLIILSLHIMISIVISLAFLLKRQFGSFAMIWRAIWWNIVNLGKTLRKRRRIQDMRIVSDKYIFDNLAVSVDWKSFFMDFKRVSKDIAQGNS